MIPGADASARSQHFAEHGVVMIEHALVASDLQRMAKAFAPASAGKAGQRTIPETLRDWLASHAVLQGLADGLAGEPLRLVRLIAFDKTPEANWFVPWHQDRTVALAEHFESDQFGPWTLKDGQLHAEAPIAVLERMVTLRVHLDACTEINGPLEVLAGTHRLGRLDKAAIVAQIGNRVASLCLAERGDILAMRPLLLHRSQRGLSPRRRRVLHLEFGPAELPMPACWGWDGPVRTGLH